MSANIGLGLSVVEVGASEHVGYAGLYLYENALLLFGHTFTLSIVKHLHCSAR